MGMMGTSVQIRTTTRLTVIVMEMIGKTCFSHPIMLRIQVISMFQMGQRQQRMKVWRAVG